MLLIYAKPVDKFQSLYHQFTSCEDVFFIWPNSPPVGEGLLIHEVSRSHTTTHHSL